VLAQRLVRRLCAKCKTPHEASPEQLQELLGDYMHVMTGVEGAPPADDTLRSWRERFGSATEGGASGAETGSSAGGPITLYKPVGCDHCSKSGYRGRVGIHELMMVTRGLRYLIQTGGRADDLARHALADGMRTLRQDGIEKVLQGHTTIEEVRASS
jgi:type II secretory ATPase GspE/PulE/Tfp pilus assembly ATPase PilB-like protein